MVKKLRSEGKMPNSLLRRIASTPMPPEMALDFLAGIDESPSMVDRVCLLLAGSIPGAWEQEIIENSGARIVADATCLGDRVFQLETRESGDPYFNLYESYIEKNNCPHRRPVTSLIDYIREIISQSTKKPGQKIDGIIYRSLKYCHPWGLLAERIKREIPLPILRVDDDLASPAVESLRTRACAFTEMLNAKKKKTLA
jgi:benzoyl-CoA reductase/2-hydroxyglutaryl-CoA dehydratase subunit BcrC/BadD/HgdB